MVEATLDKAINRLKDQHIRITPNENHLNYLITHRNHPTVETLFSDLSAEQSNLSMATIYNTLNLLVSLALSSNYQMKPRNCTTTGRPHFPPFVTIAVKLPMSLRQFPKIQSGVKQV